MNSKWLKIFLLLLIMIYLFRDNIIYTPVLNIFSNENIKGQIIDEKHYKRRGQFTNQFTYYYKFSANGKDYSNPSYDEKYKVGDTVLVEYNETFPFMNRIKNKKSD
ncbi:hypothetical protein [Chryseobacterium schmidteae]|uniref:hypothetical protein n=1 Tax=Chryseobacterium schmidteae TaxID=2730404 RepID=UPI00158BCF63|nr:hypothetical protein [Chryseobacterium schmidteae]